LIADRTKQLKVLADQYNKKIEDLVAGQEDYLKNFMDKVNNDVSALKQFFPGATFIAPADLVVPMPSPIDTNYGIQLRGGGNLNFLSNLPNQLEKIKKALDDQGKLAQKEGSDYMNEQESKIKDAKSQWQQIAQQCDSAMGDFIQNYAHNMKKAGEEKQKTSADVGQFCSKYQRLANTNPVAGCSGDHSPSKLYDDAFKIAAHLNPSVLSHLGQYEKLCAQAQNAPKPGTEKDRRPLLIRLCEMFDNDWKKSQDFKKNELLNKIPDLRIRKNALIFLDSKDQKTLPNNIPSGVLKDLLALKLLQSQKGKSKESLIAELNGKQKSKEDLAFDQAKASIKNIESDIPAMKDFNDALENVANNLTLDNIQTGRKNLDELLKSSDDYIKAAGDNGDQVKSDLDKLKGISDSISQKSLDALPEVPPSGLGSDHSELFDDEDGSNLCISLKNQQLANSMVDCKERSDFVHCVDKKVEKPFKTIPPGIYDIVERKLQSISSYEGVQVLANKWSKLGQEGMGNCTAEDASRRSTIKPRPRINVDQPSPDDGQYQMEGRDI
jgi:hypothetical protein